jgi:hypothetical protein
MILLNIALNTCEDLNCLKTKYILNTRENLRIPKIFKLINVLLLKFDSFSINVKVKRT